MRAGLDTMTVYIQGSWGGGAGGIWVKSDPTAERIYPLPGITLNEIREWEAVAGAV